jgi:DNA-binding NtrC family response regulator
MFFGLEKVLSHVGERQELAEAILQYAKDLFGGDHGFLLDFEETTGNLREVASFGEVEDMLNQDMRIFAQYSVDRPDEIDNIIVTDDAKSQKKLSARKSVRRDMTKGVIIFPLASGERAVGAIYIGRKGTSALKIKGLKQEDLKSIGQVLGHITNLNHTYHRLHLQNRSLQDEVNQSATIDNFIGTSAAVLRVRQALELVVETDIPVSLIGEKGTGKYVAAEALHNNSTRRRRPFVHLDLSSIPEPMIEGLIFGQLPGSEGAPARGRRGSLRDTRGGTLVIENVEKLSVKIQNKLVKAMNFGKSSVVGDKEEYNTEFRLITTTKENLRSLYENEKLSQEFYLKLNVFPLVIPPLRDRIEDLPMLVEFFVEKNSASFGKSISGISSEAYDFLGTWKWEENLAELEKEIRQAVLRTPDGGLLTPAMLSTPLISRRQPSMVDSGDGTLKQRVARIEKRMIMDSLEKNRHNQSITADQLGLSRQALINKLHRYGIETGRKYKRMMRDIEAQSKKEMD